MSEGLRQVRCASMLDLVARSSSVTLTYTHQVSTFAAEIR